jgi:hypothetical protein
MVNEACDDDADDCEVTYFLNGIVNCPLTAITEPDTLAVDSRGVFLFIADEHEYNAELYTAFTYTFVDPDDKTIESSTLATVSITVAAANDAPIGVDQMVNFTVDGTDDGSLEIDLTFTDSDENATNSWTYDPTFAPNMFAKIETFPIFGETYQGVDGSLIDSSVTSVPTVFGYASEVMRFSSQFSLCGSDCYEWLDPNCNQADTKATSSCQEDLHGACAVDFGDELIGGDGSCFETAWQGSAIIGEEDFYPGCQ